MSNDEDRLQQRTCARCRQPAEEGARWWQFRRYLTNTLTAVWLCWRCQQVRSERCAVCDVRPALASIPLCVDCLIGYQMQMDGTDPIRPKRTG